jgi:hypothetical protein
MAAKDWLIKYGYSEFPDGRYRKLGRNTQVWEPVEGGWLRYEIEEGQEVQEIHSVAESHQGQEGLHRKLSPREAFNWVYPEEEIEKIYREACESQGIS